LFAGVCTLEQSETSTDDHGVDGGRLYFTADYDGWKVRFTHRPDDEHKFVCYPKRLNVHGHAHSKTRGDRRLINLSVEAIDFRPVWITDVLDERITELSA
jgi:calcineurin-like phosphoesterase family protein